MPELSELEAASTTETNAAVSDRRRPGRLEKVNPDLIPLLRGQEPEIEFEDVDDNAPLRGVFFGVLFSVPIWVGIAYLGSLILSK